MWPVVFTFARTYMPYIVWPAAAVIGTIGYGIEKVVRGDKEQQWKNKSTVEERNNRFLEECDKIDLTHIDKLKDKTFVPKTIFERNK